MLNVVILHEYVFSVVFSFLSFFRKCMKPVNNLNVRIPAYFLLMSRDLMLNVVIFHEYVFSVVDSIIPVYFLLLSRD